MSRLAQITNAPSDSRAAALLDETERQLGRTPNLYRTMANAPAALSGYLAFRLALQSGVLGVRVRELIALLVAEENDCHYCVSAHTLRAGKLGIAAETAFAARAGEATGDAHIDALLVVAASVLRTRGEVPDEILASSRLAGVTDEEMVEVCAHVALNVYSNYVARLTEPDLDFPAAPVLATTPGTSQTYAAQG